MFASITVFCIEQQGCCFFLNKLASSSYVFALTATLLHKYNVLKFLQDWDFFFYYFFSILLKNLVVLYYEGNYVLHAGGGKNSSYDKIQ